MAQIVYPGTATPADVRNGKTFSAGTYYNAAGENLVYPSAPSGVAPPGEIWEEMLSMPTGLIVDKTYWLRTIGDRFFLILDAYDGPRGELFYTDDLGATWTNVILPLPSSTGSLVALDNVWLLSGGGTRFAFRSSDNGETWTTITAPTDIKYMTEAVQKGNVCVYVGGGIARSTDSGLSWSRVGTLVANKVRLSRGNFVAFNTRDTTGNSVLTSSDGLTWTARGSALGQSVRDVFDIPGIIVLPLDTSSTVTAEVAYSIDGGINWRKITIDGYRQLRRWFQRGNSIFGIVSPLGGTDHYVVQINMYSQKIVHISKLPTTDFTQSLASFIPVIGGRILATRGGQFADTIYTSDDDGRTWRSIKVEKGSIESTYVAVGDYVFSSNQYATRLKPIKYTRFKVL